MYIYIYGVARLDFGFWMILELAVLASQGSTDRGRCWSILPQIGAVALHFLSLSQL